MSLALKRRDHVNHRPSLKNGEISIDLYGCVIHIGKLLRHGSLASDGRRNRNKTRRKSRELGIEVGRQLRNLAAQPNVLRIVGPVVVGDGGSAALKWTIQDTRSSLWSVLLGIA